MSSRLMKNTTHNSSVAAVRPCRNKCTTGIPASAGSCTVNCVPGANEASGLMKPSSCATRSGARPASARKRTDSGSVRVRIGTMINGAMPPTTNNDHQPKQAGGEHRTKRAPRHAPFLGDGGRDITDRLGVEAVEEQHGRAGQQQFDLKTADRLLVDEISDFNCRRTAALRNRHRRPF